MLRVFTTTAKYRSSVGHSESGARQLPAIAWSVVRYVTTGAFACMMTLCLVRPALGQGSDPQRDIERFQLFNACRPMSLVVEDLNDDARDIGLNESRLRVAADSRLRAARLYTSDRSRAGFSRLYVNVNVVGPAFNISLEYDKNWSCPALTDTFPFGSTREVNHGGKKERAVFARVQGADDRACEGWTYTGVFGPGVRPV